MAAREEAMMQFMTCILGAFRSVPSTHNTLKMKFFREAGGWGCLYSGVLEERFDDKICNMHCGLTLLSPEKKMP
jgi:hypothetical protein